MPDGVSNVIFRPAFPDEVAKELSSEEWLKVRTDYDKYPAGYRRPGISSAVVIGSLAIVAYALPAWRLYTEVVLALAIVRVVVLFFAAGGHRAGYEYGFQSGVSLGVEKLAAEIDREESPDCGKRLPRLRKKCECGSEHTPRGAQLSKE